MDVIAEDRESLATEETVWIWDQHRLPKPTPIEAAWYIFVWVAFRAFLFLLVLFLASEGVVRLVRLMA